MFHEQGSRRRKHVTIFGILGRFSQTLFRRRKVAGLLP